MPAVTIADLHKYYGALHALDGIDFSIEEGEFFGLLGPNGAGKSTLINIMAGLTLASSGTIRVMGNDVRSAWRQARRILGVVPQELVSDPFFTVREILQLQAGYFGLGTSNHAWIDELLEVLSLTDKANENAQRLSGGMKRRLLIAQALVHKPQVLVLDEPTAGVDVELRKMLWEFTQRLHRQGHTILLTTHYLEEAENLCQRIAILNQGKLVALDKTRDLLALYPYRLLSLHLQQAATEIVLPDALRDKVESLDDHRLTLRLHREHDRIGAVLESLSAANIRFYDLSTSEPRLEDVFVGLTRKNQQHEH